MKEQGKVLSSRIVKRHNFSNYIWHHLSFQVKDKQKRKQPTKGIRVNEDGDASLEDLTNSVAQRTTENDVSTDPDGPKSSKKKVSLYFLN